MSQFKAAVLAKVTDRAIRKAIRRGELLRHPKTRRVRLHCVIQWASRRRKSGRPPARLEDKDTALRDKELRLLAHVLHRVVRQFEIDALASFFKGHRAAMRESLYKQFYPPLAAHELEPALPKAFFNLTPFEVACVTARVISSAFNAQRPNTRIMHTTREEDAAVSILRPQSIRDAGEIVRQLSREDLPAELRKTLKAFPNDRRSVALQLLWKRRQRLGKNALLCKRHGYTMAYLLDTKPRAAAYWKKKTDESFRALYPLLKRHLSRNQPAADG